MSVPLPKRLDPYCLGMFTPARADATTCSGSCRMALHRALRYESYADVPSACLRRDTYAEDRRAATGFGLVSASEGYEADLRVRVVIGGEQVECSAQREALIPWEQQLAELRRAERERLEDACQRDMWPEGSPAELRAVFDSLCDGSAPPRWALGILRSAGLVRYDRTQRAWVHNR